MRLKQNLLGFTLFSLLLFSGPLDALDFSSFYNGLAAQLEQLNPFANQPEAGSKEQIAESRPAVVQPIPYESLTPHARKKVRPPSRKPH